MDTITYEGVAYVKASVLAKRFRYTADYIGQLCRSGKIDARLVGRSWYVNEVALIAHKEGRYRPTRSTEIVVEAVTDTPVTPIVVHPRLSRVTAKMTQVTPRSHNFSSRLAFVPATYVADESSLIPQPLQSKKQQKEPAKLPITLVEEQKLSIREVDEPKGRLSFTDLPEIQLSGVLEISDISEQNIDIAESFVTIDEISDLQQQTPPQTTVQKQPSVSPLAPRHAETHHVELGQSRELVRPTVAVKATFTPLSVQTGGTIVTKGNLGLLSFSVVTLGVMLFLILTLTSNLLVVEGVELQSSVNFDLASAALMWELF